MVKRYKLLSVCRSLLALCYYLLCSCLYWGATWALLLRGLSMTAAAMGIKSEEKTYPLSALIERWILRIKQSQRWWRGQVCTVFSAASISPRKSGKQKRRFYQHYFITAAEQEGCVIFPLGLCVSTIFQNLLLQLGLLPQCYTWFTISCTI